MISSTIIILYPDSFCVTASRPNRGRSFAHWPASMGMTSSVETFALITPYLPFGASPLFSAKTARMRSVRTQDRRLLSRSEAAASTVHLPARYSSAAMQQYPVCPCVRKLHNKRGGVCNRRNLLVTPLLLRR
jgi:hypothetical protein